MPEPLAAILYGRLLPAAAQDEQDVLVEVQTVREALGCLGYRTEEVTLDLDLSRTAEALQVLSPNLVFNLVESVAGRDRLVHLAPALLEHLGLPFTGCSTTAIFSTSNKLLAKALLQGGGVPTPAWREVRFPATPATGAVAGAIAAQLPPPWIVKSVWDHASIGISASSVAATGEALQAELARRRGSADLFVERYVEGREFNLSLLEMEARPVVLPVAEIHFVDYAAGAPRIVDYAAKWASDSPQYRNTPRSFEFPPEDEPLLHRLREQALRCWELFQLGGYARVDFRVDPGGQPWVLEVNANPCLSPDAGLQAAAARAGLSAAQVIQHIVAAAGRRPQPQSREDQ